MKIKARYLPGRPIGPGDDIVISSDKLEEYVQERIKLEVLKARLDEVKNQVNVYSYYPTDPGGISNRKLRLKHLKAELSKLKGEE